MKDNMDTPEKKTSTDPDRLFEAIGATLEQIVTEGRDVVVSGGRGQPDTVDKVPATAADINAAMKWVKDAKEGKMGQSETAKKIEARMRALQEGGQAMPPIDEEGDDAATG